MNYLSCTFEPAQYLIISAEVEPLIYYSHFVAIFAALAISLLVFFHNPKLLVSKLFLTFAGVFSVWAFLDVILWATNDPGLVMFSWSIQVLAEPILYTIAFYLFYYFLNQRIPSFGLNFFVVMILLPLVFFLPTTLTLGAVELSYCESEEGPIALYYTYFLNITFILLIVYTALKGIPYLRSNSDRKKSVLFFILGLTIFLVSFTIANLVSSFTDNWLISQYGLFGMPIFAAFVAYSIVQFKAFKIQIAGAQILVVTLLALVASLLVVKPELRIPITSLTLLFTSIAGFFLIHSIQKEIQQRKEIEELALNLESANARLKKLDKLKSEFVSIASHQLRSPLTSIRGYASMLVDGSYGNIPFKARKPLERIEKSAGMMALSVEDFLSVSRIESGNMVYDCTDFNIVGEVTHITDDVRQRAIKKGLLLSMKTDVKGQGIVHADLRKVQQIIHNLINNAFKYTPKGSITVYVHDDLVKKKIYVEIIDTGIGIKSESLRTLFQKFSRAENASDVNVEGTGLGLFVAQQMALAMDGDITAHSEGLGKGSHFILQLPLQM
ncbi:hypothetical protein KC723_01070 [Candidatus Kaiserbacteria bacterium]|nr:hypothetical protein [Candidatus Kaiserbacteria bacterium]